MHVLKDDSLTRAFGLSPCPSRGCCLLGKDLSCPNCHLPTDSAGFSGPPAAADGAAEPGVLASSP